MVDGKAACASVCLIVRLRSRLRPIDVFLLDERITPHMGLLGRLTWMNLNWARVRRDEAEHGKCQHIFCISRGIISSSRLKPLQQMCFRKKPLSLKLLGYVWV